MKTFITAIRACEATTKKIPKFAALQDLSDTAKRLIVEAQSPYRVFGVKKYDAPTMYADVDSLNIEDDVFNILDMLAAREITGNAAREAVTTMLSKFTKETSELLARIINKDLKAGFSSDTVEKIYPGLVPSFGVMLAVKADDKFKYEFPVQAELKFDGQRTIAICDISGCAYFSRSGKSSEHLNGLFDEELQNIVKHIGEAIVIDGEVMGSNFTETINAKKSTNQDAKNNLKLFAFDYMTLAEWKDRKCTTVQSQRSENLSKILSDLKCLKIIKSKQRNCDTKEDLMKFYNEALTDGFEGLILKKPNSLYEWDRSKSWAKVKPVIDVDLTVLGFYPGQVGTRLGNTLGGIIVEGTDENGNHIKSDCGSGFNDEMRNEVWNNQDKYLGMKVMLEAQELSVNATDTSYSLRFPIFIRFRDDL